jgi:hypothetical protein
MRRHESLATKGLPKPVTVSLDSRVLEWILFEVNKHPNSEDGGKYIGRMDLARQNEDGAISVTINDFLPGGPSAKRTAVEFLPDGEYQERLFREIERLDPAVEHLGSWHTHHCNGLNRLSPGDIEGYFRTVNKRDYRPNVFIASLVKFIPQRPKSEPWIDHFLFVRGDTNYYQITNEVRFVNTSPLSQGITGHGPDGENDVSTGGMPLASHLWFESEVGRDTLAADRDSLNKYFPGGFKATRKRNQIQIRCEDNGRAITILYPVDRQDSNLKVAVLRGTEVIVSMDCNVAHRIAAYAAAMTVLEHL